MLEDVVSALVFTPPVAIVVGNKGVHRVDKALPTTNIAETRSSASKFC